MKTHALALSLAMLSQSERACLASDRPGSVSVVWRKPAPTEADEPLPADFTPAPFVPYVSDLGTLDENETEAARREAAQEVEALEAEASQWLLGQYARDAVAFASDYSATPRDYSPDARERQARIVPRMVPIRPGATMPAIGPALSHAALLAAVPMRATG